MSTEQALLKSAAVFVPELKPLIADIEAAIATAEKVSAVLKPAFDRIEKNEGAFFELAAAAGGLNAIMPDIARALKTTDKLRALAAVYQARVQAAIK